MDKYKLFEIVISLYTESNWYIAKKNKDCVIVESDIYYGEKIYIDEEIVKDFNYPMICIRTEQIKGGNSSSHFLHFEINKKLFQLLADVRDLSNKIELHYYFEQIGLIGQEAECFDENITNEETKIIQNIYNWLDKNVKIQEKYRLHFISGNAEIKNIPILENVLINKHI
jgi:hypothetical protein